MRVASDTSSLFRRRWQPKLPLTARVYLTTLITNITNSEFSTSSDITVMLTHDMQNGLIDYLEANSRRYVPFVRDACCDAVFVSRWFETHLFDGLRRPPDTDRLLEMNRPGTRYVFSRVLPIKHQIVIRDEFESEKLNFKWRAKDVEEAEIFLLSCADSPDHVAVLPTQYLKTRYGNYRIMTGDFPLGQVPPILAPFMVRITHLVDFLDSIYSHALGQLEYEIINPTYSAKYHKWKPALHLLDALLPTRTWRTKFDTTVFLYFAFQSLCLPLKLSRQGQPGHFLVNGSFIEYWRKSWGRVGHHIFVALKHQLPWGQKWNFLYLENDGETEAVCLPRRLVPSKLMGYTRNGGRRSEKTKPGHAFKVLATEWAEFTFPMLNRWQIASSIVSIVDKYAWEEDLGSEDTTIASGCETSSSGSRWM